jgi:hypothetical protein
MCAFARIMGREGSTKNDMTHPWVQPLSTICPHLDGIPALPLKMHIKKLDLMEDAQQSV